MADRDHSGTAPVCASEILRVHTIKGEPRILDTDLAIRLGFGRPADIRKLVQRHEAALTRLGTLATVARVVNGGRAQVRYLNRKQAIFVTTKSETAQATEITIEIIERFDAYEQQGGPATPVVFERSGRQWLNSRDLARLCQKSHDEVVAAIRALIARLPNGGVPYFEGTQQESFDIDRDGVALLARGNAADKLQACLAQFRQAVAVPKNEDVIPTSGIELRVFCADEREVAVITAKIAEGRRLCEGLWMQRHRTK